MPRFAANISTLFTERPFLERPAAARAAGFAAIECQFPYAHSAAELQAALADAGLPLVLLNTPPGDFAAGERGLAALPGREADFRDAFARALDYASRLGVPRIHVMAGIPPKGADHASCLALFEQNLRAVAPAAEAAGITLLLEPLNARDVPGYLYSRPEEAAALIERLGLPNLKLQYDFYHVQVMRGDLLRNFERFRPIIGHVQFAGAPERQEPDIGEVNYDYLFAALDRLGWDGWVGAEYLPAGRTEDGLGWAVRYGIAPAATTLATGGLTV
jgi:hydroxypyruvate isomerase